MPLRKSKATKAKEAVTDQVSDRTDDLVAALDAAKEALARASAAAGAGRELVPSWARKPARPPTSSCPSGPSSAAARPPAAATAGCWPGRPAWPGWGCWSAGSPGARPSSAGHEAAEAGGGWDRAPSPPRRRPGRLGRGDPAARQRRRRRPGPDAAELAQPGRARYRPVPCLTTRPSLARAARLLTTTPRTSLVVNGSIRRWVRARSAPPSSGGSRRRPRPAPAAGFLGVHGPPSLPPVVDLAR